MFVITKGVWGGAQKYVFDLAVGLKNTFDIVVVYGTEGELSKKLAEQAIKTIRIESLGRDVNPLLDLSSFFKLKRIFAEEKPDIIHLNSSKIGGLGALAGKLSGIRKIIFTAHGWAFNEDRNVISKIIIWKISWLTALLSSHIIVLGNKEKSQTEHMPFVSHKKISLIRLGISSPDFFDRQTARRALAGILNKTENYFEHMVIVGTVAELHANKGLEYALSGISAITDTHISEKLIYIDIGGGELKAHLMEYIRKYGLQDKAFLTGFVRDAQNYLKAFDIFILPSLKEGLPYTLLEAGMAALPVIATHVGAIPELIKDSETGILVEPKKSQAISQALTHLLSDSHIRAQYGEKLSRLVREEFSKETMIRKTEETYRN